MKIPSWLVALEGASAAEYQILLMSVLFLLPRHPNFGSFLFKSPSLTTSYMLRHGTHRSCGMCEVKEGCGTEAHCCLFLGTRGLDTLCKKFLSVVRFG